jgi:hypothetical protein
MIAAKLGMNGKLFLVPKGKEKLLRWHNMCDNWLYTVMSADGYRALYPRATGRSVRVEKSSDTELTHMETRGAARASHEQPVQQAPATKRSPTARTKDSDKGPQKKQVKIIGQCDSKEENLDVDPDIERWELINAIADRLLEPYDAYVMEIRDNKGKLRTMYEIKAGWAYTIIPTEQDSERGIARISQEERRR